MAYSDRFAVATESENSLRPSTTSRSALASGVHNPPPQRFDGVSLGTFLSQDEMREIRKLPLSMFYAEPTGDDHPAFTQWMSHLSESYGTDWDGLNEEDSDLLAPSPPVPEPIPEHPPAVQAANDSDYSETSAAFEAYYNNNPSFLLQWEPFPYEVPQSVSDDDPAVVLAAFLSSDNIEY